MICINTLMYVAGLCIDSILSLHIKDFIYSKMYLHSMMCLDNIITQELNRFTTPFITRFLPFFPSFHQYMKHFELFALYFERTEKP